MKSKCSAKHNGENNANGERAKGGGNETAVVNGSAARTKDVHRESVMWRTKARCVRASEESLNVSRSKAMDGCHICSAK